MNSGPQGRWVYAYIANEGEAVLTDACQTVTNPVHVNSRQSWVALRSAYRPSVQHTGSVKSDLTRSARSQYTWLSPEDAGLALQAMCFSLGLSN